MEKTDESKKVSIILPTYNGEKYIRETINSCLGQTYNNLELIIVDDASSDKTFKIVSSYSDKRIKYLRNEKNLGLSGALNRGFAISSGEYLTWQSDDNFYDNRAIEILIKELVLNKNVGFVYSNFYQVDENGKIKRMVKTANPEVLEMKNCVGPCFLYRRKVYEEIGDYNPDFFLAEDYEYWLRISKKFKLGKINNYLCYYRLHSKSLRFQNQAYKIEEQAQRASEQFVRSSMRYYHLGKVLFCKKDYKNANIALIKSITLEPFNLGTWKLLIFNNLTFLVFFLIRFKDKLSNYIITKIYPLYYFKSFYRNNINRIDWGEKKACFSLSFDCDYTKDIVSLPFLLDILSRYSFKASFACVGKLIEKYPEEHMRIIREGHEIINHTYTHPNNEELNPVQKFNELTIDQQKIEIEKCHEVCRNVLGYTPIGFRTPHFGNLHTESVYDILKELGYKYSSSTSAIRTLNHGIPFIKKEIVEFPISNCPEHPFAVFDTWHSLERGSGKHKKNGEFLRLFKMLIDIGVDTKSYINLYFDPQDVLGLKDFILALDYIEERKKDIQIITYKNIFEKMYAKKK